MNTREDPEDPEDQPSTAEQPSPFETSPPPSASSANPEAATFQRQGKPESALAAIAQKAKEDLVTRPVKFHQETSQELKQARHERKQTERTFKKLKDASPEERAAAEEALKNAKSAEQKFQWALKNGDTKAVLRLARAAALVLCPIPVVGPAAEITYRRMARDAALWHGVDETSPYKLTPKQRLAATLKHSGAELLHAGLFTIDVASGGLASLPRLGRAAKAAKVAQEAAAAAKAAGTVSKAAKIGRRAYTAVQAVESIKGAQAASQTDRPEQAHLRTTAAAFYAFATGSSNPLVATAAKLFGQLTTFGASYA